MQKIKKHKKINQFKYEPGSIIRIEAKSNYCKIFFIDCDRPLVVTSILNLVHQKLPANIFVKVHRSNLVNRLFIKSVSGTHTKTVELTNGELVAVSRRRHTVFLPVKSS